MVSIDSVVARLAELSNSILILMQEGDEGQGFANVEWADEMFSAHEFVNKAIKSLSNAREYDR